METSTWTASLLVEINSMNHSLSPQLTSSAPVIRSGQTLSGAARRGHNKLAEGRDICLVAVETRASWLNMSVYYKY